MSVFELSKTQKLKEGLQFDTADVTPTEKAEIEKCLKWEGDGFDLRTHIVHPKSGMLLKYQPYRRAVDQGEVIYHRKGDDGHERRYSESGKLLDPEPTPKKKVENGNDKRVSGERP